MWEGYCATPAPKASRATAPPMPQSSWRWLTQALAEAVGRYILLLVVGSVWVVSGAGGRARQHQPLCTAISDHCCADGGLASAVE